MKTMTRKQLEPGMVVARSVENQHGQTLITEGTVLEPKHLRGLAIWGIEDVAIRATDPAAERFSSAGPPGSKRMQEALSSLLSSLLSQNQKHRESPIVSKLAEIAEKRLTRRADTIIRQASTPPPSAPPKPLILEDLLAKTSAVATLPAIYQKLLGVVNDPSASMKDISAVISSDPGLTARLLRIVNSAYYAFPKTIDTVTRAITIIGTEELCDLALATSITSAFGGALEGIVDMEQFWRHSIAVGSLSRSLCLARREPNAERYFVMGLLHDIGRLLLLGTAPVHMRTAIERSKTETVPLYAAEEEIAGVSHARLSHELFKLWNLPAAQGQAILYHHQPWGAQQYPLESATIHIADCIVIAAGFGNSGNPVIPTVDLGSWERLELDVSVIDNLLESVEKHVDDLAKIFVVRDL